MSVEAVLQLIKDHDAAYVDIRSPTRAASLEPI